MCYRILHDLVDVDSACFLSAQCILSRVLVELAKLPVVSESDKNDFAHRNINTWNSLPDYIFTASFISIFKGNSNGFDFSKFLLF